MDEDLKRKALEEYIKNRQGWSDQNVMDDFKASKRLDNDRVEAINRVAPIDESDYSDYSVQRKYTPEQTAELDRIRNAQLDKMQHAETALNERGYEKYRKKGAKGYGVDDFAFKNPKTGKVLRTLTGAIPAIGTALAGYAALQSPDASAAVGDALIPGGLEGLGPSADDAAIENPQANPELRRAALQRMLGK